MVAKVGPKTTTRAAKSAARTTTQNVTARATKTAGSLTKMVDKYTPSWLQGNLGDIKFVDKNLTRADKALTKMSTEAAKKTFVDQRIAKALEKAGEDASPKVIKQVTKGAVKEAEAQLASKGGAKLLGKAAKSSLKAGFFNGTKSLLGRLGALSNKIPVAGAFIAAITEVPDVIDGFKEGRGLAQIAKSVTKVGAAGVGAAIGGAIGSVVPVVGTAIGAIAGGFVGDLIGDKIGGGLFGSNHEQQETAEAAEEAPAQQHSAQKNSFGKLTDFGKGVYPAGSALAGLPIL